MGKITRLSEASHVTTIVPQPGGDPEVVPQVLTETGPRGETEGQTGNENTSGEVVELDEDGNPVRKDVGGNVIEGEPDGHFHTVVDDPTDAEASGFSGTFEASGSADVVEGEQPPVEKSADEVKSWVGDDYVKAERALAAERNGKNRSGLVSWLEKVATSR